MGCETKFVSLKIEQANGNNYMNAVTPNRDAVDVCGSVCRLVVRAQASAWAAARESTRRPSWMTPALPGIDLSATLDADHFAVFVEKDCKI